jgi:hypothetical protein
MNDPASMNIGLQAVWSTHESVQKQGVPTVCFNETKWKLNGICASHVGQIREGGVCKR